MASNDWLKKDGSLIGGSGLRSMVKVNVDWLRSGSSGLGHGPSLDSQAQTRVTQPGQQRGAGRLLTGSCPRGRSMVDLGALVYGPQTRSAVDHFHLPLLSLAQGVSGAWGDNGAACSRTVQFIRAQVQ